MKITLSPLNVNNCLVLLIPLKCQPLSATLAQCTGSLSLDAQRCFEHRMWIRSQYWYFKLFYCWCTYVFWWSGKHLHHNEVFVMHPLLQCSPGQHGLNVFIAKRRVVETVWIQLKWTGFSQYDIALRVACGSICRLEHIFTNILVGNFDCLLISIWISEQLFVPSMTLSSTWRDFPSGVSMVICQRAGSFC